MAGLFVNAKIDLTYNELSLKFQDRLSFGTRSDHQPVYIGWSLPGTDESHASWVIKKLFYDDTSSGANYVGSVFAGGSSNPCWAWTDASSLTYASVTGGV